MKEKAYRRLKENANQLDTINFELQFSVAFNLANQLQSSGILEEALAKYTEIVKNKDFARGIQVRVNMGNIYFAQGRYGPAVKMYRMVYDWLPLTSKEMRLKILKNIALSHVKEGKLDVNHTLNLISALTPLFITGSDHNLRDDNEGKPRLPDCVQPSAMSV